MFAQGLPPLALRSLSFFLRSSLRSFMPIVSRTLIAGDYLMALVKSGSVKGANAFAWCISQLPLLQICWHTMSPCL